MTISRRQVLGAILSGSTLAVAGCASGDGSTDGPDDSSEPDEDSPQVGDIFLSSSFPMEIYDPETETRLAQIHWHGQLSNSHWHQQPLGVPLDQWESYEMGVLDQDGAVVSLGEGERIQLAMARTEKTPADLLEHEVSGSNVDIRGLNSGDGQYTFRLLSGGSLEWESPPLQISVD
jgi:hypothetical protein